MTYFVYWVHLPEHTKEEGYVGITNNPKIRWADHKYQASRGTHRNNYFQNAINKYKDLLIHEIILEGSLEECATYEHELRPSEKIGWNLHIGGECPGMTGRKHTKATKKQLSKLAKEKNFAAVMHNEESWKKISKAMSGGKNHQAKKIICNETGEVFDTVTAASKWLGTSSQAVSKHLNKKSKSVKGYTFNYVKEESECLNTQM
jgi:hypothetical protein